MFIAPLLLMGLFSMSCSDDDEGGDNNNVDVIVGAWKISSIIVDDTDIYPILALQGVCEIESVSNFYNDYTVVNETFEENSEGDCVAGTDDTGTWSKEGNIYTITVNEMPTSAELIFSDNNNKFSVNQEFEGQMARITFSRQ